MIVRPTLLALLVALAAPLASATVGPDALRAESLAIDDVTIAEGNAGAVAATFTVTLSGASPDTVTVDYATADGTAVAPGDYSGAAGTLTFLPGETTQTVSVDVNGDALDEEDETYTVDLTNAVNAIIDDGQGVGTITDDDPLPALSIDDVGVTEGDGGTFDATFTVGLDNPSGRAVTVDYGTADGTASAPADYDSTNGSLTFTPGQTTKQVTVAVNGDLLDEVNETYTVELSNETNAAIADGVGLGTITDDDPLPALSVNDVTVTEGNGGTVDATFVVGLDNASGRAVTVDFATANGTATAPGDYAATSGTLTFTAGQTTKQVTVHVNGDLLDEFDENFTLNLSGAGNATISDGVGVGTITDDEGEPSLSIDDVTVTEGSSGTMSATFTVTLAPVSGLEVSVQYATADGSASSPADYASSSGSLTFTAGQTTKQVTVQVNGDTLDETDENFTLNLSGAVNATISDGVGVGTITDDDPPPAISVDDVAITEGDAGTTSATFTVGLSQPSGLAVSVDYATANGTALAPADYTATSGTLNFAPGQATKQVTVLVQGDLLDEANETFTVNLANAVNATIADNQGLGTISDDDPLPALTINDVSVTEGDSGTVAATFSVSLSPLSGRSVTVDYATVNNTAVAPGDYTATSGTLTFTPGQTTKQVTVQVKGDLLAEIDENYFLDLTNAVNAAIADPRGVGTIIDDDGEPSLSIGDVTVTEGNSGTVNANFSVSLSAASGQTVSVGYATADGTANAGSDYVAAGGNLVFTPGQLTKTVTIQVTGDTLDEIDEAFTVNLSDAVHAVIADETGVGTILDDDPFPTVSVNNATVTEGDAGTVDAAFTVSLNTASSRTITVDYSTADGSATSPADYAAAAGTLTFSPGQTTKTVTVHVNGDVLDEVNETYFVNLSSPSNATIGDGEGLGTITDNDPLPAVAVDDVTVSEGDGGTVAATFTLSLNVPSGRSLSVDYGTADVDCDDARRLPGGERDRQLRGRRDLQAGDRARQRRPARRGQRDVPHESLEPGERDHRRRAGHRHDRRRRPPGRDLRGRRERPRGQLRAGERHL